MVIMQPTLIKTIHATTTSATMVDRASTPKRANSLLSPPVVPRIKTVGIKLSNRLAAVTPNHREATIKTQQPPLPSVEAPTLAPRTIVDLAVKRR